MAKPKNNFFFPLVVASSVLILALTVVTLTSGHSSSQNMACAVENFSEGFDPSAKVAIYNGKEVTVPQMAFAEPKTPVLGASEAERWIEVDLSEQKLRAWEGDNLFLETPVSTGLPWWPTPQGTFYIWIKLRSVKMEGGSGKYYYFLPNVPYTMFFENDQVPSWRGYGLHGTYWHNDFGHVHSHGCINLPTPVAEKLFYWTSPVVPEGKTWIKADDSNPGTRVVIHE
jgi:lipoprotein-anchoring transpeptidase ErfK/SrfK